MNLDGQLHYMLRTKRSKCTGDLKITFYNGNYNTQKERNNVQCTTSTG